MNKRKAFLWAILAIMLVLGIINYFTQEKIEACANLNLIAKTPKTSPETVWIHELYGEDCAELKRLCEAVGGNFLDRYGTDPMQCLVVVNNE